MSTMANAPHYSLKGWTCSRPRRWFAWRPVITKDGYLVWMKTIWRWIEYPPKWLVVGHTPAPPVTQYGFEPPRVRGKQ